ncbi:MAG: glycerol-3-phosphate acyltransferase, partial [Acidimicrobiales bacterium]
MRASRAIAAALLGYGLGGFPSADLAAWAAGSTDLRRRGSGNPGAANAMGVLGAGWGGAVLAADVTKAALACGIGRTLAGGTGSHLGGVAAVVGHCYPVARGFKGGKGVAASVGQCLVTFPAYFPIDLGVALVTSRSGFRHRAFAATAVASLAWVGGGIVWWKKGWPNAWGPEP